MQFASQELQGQDGNKEGDDDLDDQPLKKTNALGLGSGGPTFYAKIGGRAQRAGKIEKDNQSRDYTS